MALPDFLIVGAMKAGTTTLYRDLMLHPDIFMPEHKEPETLVHQTDRESIMREYQILFPRSAARKIKGEASTAYTKRPQFEGVAERAHMLTGGHLRIIYMRRDPIERIVSHYKHWVQQKRIAVPISEAIRDYPELMHYSRYDWQIEPWKIAFGNEAVLEINLAEYSAARKAHVSKALTHIGANPDRMPAIDESMIANSEIEMKHIDSKIVDFFIRSHFFSRRIKPHVPRSWRERGRRALLPKPKVVDASLSEADVAFIENALLSNTTGFA